MKVVLVLILYFIGIFLLFKPYVSITERKKTQNKEKR